MQALISPLTDLKTTGNRRRKSVMKLRSMQRYTGPEQLKESFILKRNRKVKVMLWEDTWKAQKNNRGVNRNLSVLPRGRPLFLGSLNQMVQRFVLSLWRTGILVSSAVVISAAKTLIARNPQYNLNHIDLDSSHWAQSLFPKKTNANYV